MSFVCPFRALRPTPEAAARVAAVPYDVVTTEEARALAAGDPLSFLHVSRAEIDLPPGTNPYDEAVYARASENFARLKADAPLLLEERPSLYVYRLRMGDHEQTGVAGCYSLDEYESGLIRRHERTRRDKEDDRTRHIRCLRAQTGPVLLIHRAAAPVDAVVRRVTAAAPLFDFAAEDGVRHTVWTVAPSEELPLIEAFAAIPALYIADGHHRAASAARVRRQLREEVGGPGEWDTVLAVAFPDEQMQLLPYNRFVTDLGRFTPATFLDALRRTLVVKEKEGPAAPVRRGEVAMRLDRRWYMIDLGEAPASARADERLDVSRLQDQVLGPLLGIADPRSDPRIGFVGGVRGTAGLEALVAAGRAAVAFAMYPVSTAEVMAIADAGGIMPPKSTWFEPKLRDGLLSHVI